MSRLPRRGVSWIEILKYLRSLLRKMPTHFTGFIGSMTTVPHPLAKQAFIEFMELNANDIGTYPELRELEEEAVAMMGEIMGCKDCTGMITTGGSEANISALYLAREHGFRRVYVAPTAHDSIYKAAKLLGMEIVEVSHREFRIDVDALRRAIESRGNGVVVVTVGTTGFGTIDPVEDVCAIAKELGCVVHVDAAFGGFVAPFVYRDRKLGFDNDAVVSVTMDPHKLGLVPIPCGGLIVRDRSWFEPLVFEARYMPKGAQIGLLGTRSGGAIAAAWAMLMYMGWEGYEAQAKELMRKLRFFETKCLEEGLELATKPEVPVACVEMRDSDRVLKDLASKGLYLYRCGLVDGVRIVIGPHVDDSTLELVAKYLAKLNKP